MFLAPSPIGPSFILLMKRNLFCFWQSTTVGLFLRSVLARRNFKGTTSTKNSRLVNGNGWRF